MQNCGFRNFKLESHYDECPRYMPHWIGAIIHYQPSPDVPDVYPLPLHQSLAPEDFGKTVYTSMSKMDRRSVYNKINRAKLLEGK